MFKPDFTALLDFKVWVAAYGQLFFQSFHRLCHYAHLCKLPAHEFGYDQQRFYHSFLQLRIQYSLRCHGLLCFGNMASLQGVGVDKVVSSGVGWLLSLFLRPLTVCPVPCFSAPCFSAHCFLPDLVPWSPSARSRFQYLSIVSASAVSVLQVFYCGIGILCGIVFASHSGLLVLDIVDRFINNFGVLAGGLWRYIPGLGLRP